MVLSGLSGESVAEIESNEVCSGEEPTRISNSSNRILIPLFSFLFFSSCEIQTPSVSPSKFVSSTNFPMISSIVLFQCSLFAD
ncbi:hypothetical protein L1987_28850 [Smallanthus sonchifolius]|uniref:Uncharacterized protein n=1 Tax=Smallanthus sonchifolius TaxID=185202 RepID=A0ACB9HZV4_9ASTR|nr:hypothetical protein L1987_28850 [Smallanthus sonchifolius]